MRIGRRFLKISGYVLGFLVVAGVAFHFWFKAHARQLIEDLVESRSNGKIRLSVDKFSFNWFSKKMEFEDAVFISTDTASATTAYRFSVKKIRLKVDAVLPIVFNRRIIIDTLTLLDPEIRVSRLRRSGPDNEQNAKEVSLPEEMGNVYNSIQDALRVLKVSRFLIDRGTFVLENRIRPGQHPVVINNLFFQIDNLAVDTTIQGARDKILFSDNVILRSHDQDIIFPDERHRLSFRKFNIDLQQKLVEFDSCTIAALRTDSSAAAFTMYMDALKLIDIDFDTLYKSEVIKADSVYCVNPKFNLSVDLGKKKEDKGPPKLEDIIKQLTGDLELDNVVVSNADFNIKTVKDGVPTSYSFTGNSFDMQGLQVDQDAASPIKVRSFAMAIRNYENFIRDSSYSVQFDSVLFRDDRIYLSNFVFHKLNNGRIINTFNIPQFYLGGLSWDALVFERKLKADQATLFYPRIDYTVSDNLRKPGGTNVFQSLASINEVMDLAYLDIIDGNIDLKVSPDVRVQLEQATLSIESYNLLQSTQLAGIKNSLTSLDFRNGKIRAGDIVMQLHDIRYIGESGRFTAANLDVRDTKGNIDFDLQEVLVDKMLVDEKRGDILSENISWQSGNIRLKSSGRGSRITSILNISNVSGSNTNIIAELSSGTVTTHVNKIRFDKLDVGPATDLRLSGLGLTGTDLFFQSGNRHLKVKSYDMADESHMNLQDISYQNKIGNGSSDITISEMKFIPYIASIISGNYRADNLVIIEPDVNVVLPGNSSGSGSPLHLAINSVQLVRPKFKFSSPSKGSFELAWNASGEDKAILLSGIDIRRKDQLNVAIGGAILKIADLNMVNAAGKKFSTGQGQLFAEMSEIRIMQKESKTDWQAKLKQLKAREILFDSSGRKKNRLFISSLDMRDLGLSTESITNLGNLTRANAGFLVDGFTGTLSNARSTLSWHNARLSRPDRSFHLDSLAWRPVADRDSFFARQSLQKDYLTLRTGAISISEADIENFIRDNTIAGKKLDIKNAILSVTKDRTVPYDSMRIKKLPVDLLKGLTVPVMVENIVANNAVVNYTEISSDGDPITIPITDINLSLTSVKNMDLEDDDSLRATASGKLLDSIRIALNLVQSYDDSLAGFRLTAQFGPARMQVLNPATVPLAGIFINSGQLDSASLLAYGNEYLAFGEMELDYRDLKVQMLKQGSELNRKNTRGFMSFLANTFVIRNKSNGKPAVIYVSRNRQRSIFNYLVKIATRGFQTGIGVGRGRKLTRQYRDHLNKLGIQPFVND